MAKEVSIAMTSNSKNQSETIKVRRARVDSITVYEVTEQELAELEQGGGGNLYLNLCLALVSIAVSFLIAVLTTTIASTRQFAVFVIITAIGFLGSLVFGILWARCHQSVSEVVRAVKGRMPKDETADTEDADADAVDKLP